MAHTPPSRDAELRRDNLRMVGKLVVVAGLMFGFGYALVPMYRAICTALGVNVLSLSERAVPGASKAGHNTQIDRSRTITVEFDANARGVWDFKPAKRSVEVHPGEISQHSVSGYGSAGHPELCAQAGHAVLQQAGVLLLQGVHLGAG
jgi:cytochrome c oxidase assembly protein subunit 11